MELQPTCTCMYKITYLGVSGGVKLSSMPIGTSGSEVVVWSLRLWASFLFPSICRLYGMTGGGGRVGYKNNSTVWYTCT